MKNYIYIIVLILCFASSNAQDLTTNYKAETIYFKQYNSLEEVITPDKQSKKITYFDKLGRPKQTVLLNEGGQQQNIITQVEYDEAGRVNKEVLPFIDTSAPLTISTWEDFKNDATVTTLSNGYYLGKHPMYLSLRELKYQ